MVLQQMIHVVPDRGAYQQDTGSGGRTGCALPRLPPYSLQVHYLFHIASEFTVKPLMNILRGVTEFVNHARGDAGFGVGLRKSRVECTTGMVQYAKIRSSTR